MQSRSLLGLACLLLCAVRVEAFVLQPRISAGSRPEMARTARTSVWGNDVSSGRAHAPANAFHWHGSVRAGAQGGARESWAAFSKRRQAASSQQMTGLVQGTGTASLGGTQTGGDGITTEMALYSVMSSAAVLLPREAHLLCAFPPVI